MLQDHLTNIEDAVKRHPSRVAFKIPHIRTVTHEVEYWSDVTFSEFLLDIEQFSRYWFHVLSTTGVPQRSTVAICVRGSTYIDVLHVYGISRAGYIPQPIGVFTSYDIIRGILEKANTRALIYESVYEHLVGDIPLPCHATLTSTEAAYLNDYPLPELPKVDSSDIGLFLHTSGTTSGSAKIIPCDYAWLDALIHKAHFVFIPSNPGQPDIVAWWGSICHISQFALLTSSVYHTSSMVQFTVGYPPTEVLIDAMRRLKINRLFSYPLLLKQYFQAARTDPVVLTTLSELDEIRYSGAGFSSRSAEEDWAYQHNINLVNIYASTECGGMILISDGLRKSRQSLLKPYEGSLFKFLPVSLHPEDSLNLLELVVPPEAPECPHISLRDKDGLFHTRDLFREVQPGKYVFAGRIDDWIHIEGAGMCDCKSLEDNAREVCDDIITDCVVVGNDRPSPILIVESDAKKKDDLAAEILRRIGPFQETRSTHEHIISEKMIMVVAPGVMPRSIMKGNIRRRAAETMYQAEIDRVFDH